MEGSVERIPQRRDTGVKGDGTSHDDILDCGNMDGLDAVQGVETLTALALAAVWDDPNDGEMTMDEDYEYEKDKVLDKRSAAGWSLCAACGVEVHDDDVAEGTGCDCLAGAE
jgi:hypothetical protein